MWGETNAAENAGRVGPYRLEGLLGRGGMGEVWRGFDQRLERPVALKRVKPELLGGDAVKRFRREAKAAARSATRRSCTSTTGWRTKAAPGW